MSAFKKRKFFSRFYQHIPLLNFVHVVKPRYYLTVCAVKNIYVLVIQKIIAWNLLRFKGDTQNIYITL